MKEKNWTISPEDLKNLEIAKKTIEHYIGTYSKERAEEINKSLDKFKDLFIDICR